MEMHTKPCIAPFQAFKLGIALQYRLATEESF